MKKKIKQDKNRDASQKKVHKGRSRRKGGRLISGILLILMVGVAFTSTAFIFFKIRQIEVYGQSRYTEKEILASAAIEVGDNLIFFNKTERIRGLFSNLPYLRTVKMIRELPGNLRIEVEEYEAVAYVQSGADVWILSEDGKLLERLSGVPGGQMIEIRGAAPQSPQLGSLVQFSSEDTIVFDAMTGLLQAVLQAGITEEISAVDITRFYNIEFYYMDRFRVKLGMPEGLEHKLKALRGVVEKLEVNERGTIDLSELIENEITRFIPNSG